MDKTVEKTMVELTGDPISSGIAQGEVFLYKQIDLNALGKTKLTVHDTAKEVLRLDATIDKTIEQLSGIISRQTLSGAVVEIFQVQLRMLEDSAFFQDIKTIVHSQKANIEFVLSNQIKSIETQFGALDNEIMRARFLDIQDVYYRLLRNCLEIEHVRVNPLKRVCSSVVFVAEKLLPSDIALLDHDKLLGIIIEEGSSVSHVAILTKALGIPAIIKIPGIASIIKAHDTVIVDAFKGKVIIHPTEKVKAAYRKKEKTLSSHSVNRRRQNAATRCFTGDGVSVCLEANVGSIKEAREAAMNGAEGIGLLRTELFYMSRTERPSIEEEYEYYAAVVSIARKSPVTVRLLDLGADKNLPYLPSYEEENPQMGIRGVRYLLRNPDLFKSHLRSIVRATKLGPIRLLIPFVTTQTDVTRCLTVVDEVCKQEGADRAGLAVGMMVEIPSAALSLQNFWPYIDFITLGTNDLVQYTFAASREDGNVEEYRQPLHPVILSIIRTCALSAARRKRDVSVCGEIASDPFTAPLLVGLGLRRLSMQPASIPLVREAIARYTLADLDRLAKKALRQKQ